MCDILTRWWLVLLYRQCAVATPREPGLHNQYSCCFLQSFRKKCEDHPSLYSVGTAGSLIGVKWPGREADYSPTSNVEFKHILWRTQRPIYSYFALFMYPSQWKAFLCLHLTWLKRTFSATFSLCLRTSIITFLMPESNIQELHKPNLPLVL